jgi:sugar lactone lactonase YvrE
MTRKLYAGVLLSSALSLVALRSDADSASLIVALDPALGQLPESITIEDDGTVLFSMSVARAVWKVIPDGLHAPELIAPLPVATGAFTSGIKVGPDGNIYVCSAGFSPALAASHVWRVSPDGATVTDFADLNNDGFPNDLVFDFEGNLFVTDSTLGLVYKIDRQGTPIVWLSDPRLVGNVAHPLLIIAAFGADGLAFDALQQNLYIDNFDFGEIFRVQVGFDGTPGPLELFVSDPRLAGSDGLAFDLAGHLYAAVNAQNQVANIAPDGTIAIVTAGPPLDNPSSLAFGPLFSPARNTLYIGSFAISQDIGIAPGTPMPNLSSIPVPIPGLPLVF